MPFEDASQIQDLNAAWPTGVDPKSEGDDHIRSIKRSVQGSLPGMTGPWTTTSKITANGFDAGGQLVQNVAVPSNPGDAVNKAVTDALDTRVSQNESDIATLDPVVAQNQADIADHETRISTLEAQQAPLQSWGNVDEDGDIQGGSGDFSSNRQGNGHYRLTFNEAASSTFAQTVTANCQGSPPFVADNEVNIEYISSTVVDCFVADGNNNLGDQPFTFMRMAT